MKKLRNVPHEEPLQDNPLQWSGACGDPPVTAGVRGHPGSGYKARSDPALYCARGDPPVIRKARADPSEVGLVGSVLYSFLKAEGGGMCLFTGLSSINDIDRQ